MTVYISADAKNLREELASLRNQGGYEEQQFWMDGLVTNGDFASNNLTGWTDNSVGTGTVVASTGAAVHTGGGSGNEARMYQSMSLTHGSVYEITFTLSSVTANPALFRMGTTNTGVDTFSFDVDANGSGTYTLVFTANAATLMLNTYAANGAFTIDNISVFETDGTDVVHRLPKGWKPKDVFEDGLLLREGAANDYEVVYDGFDYYVKPAVAPSATTQTCVIGVKA